MGVDPVTTDADTHVVYATSNSGTVYALDAGTGEIIWQTQLVEGIAVSSSPAVAG
jgi:outer membrane protein assembly factor BamB